MTAAGEVNAIESPEHHTVRGHPPSTGWSLLPLGLVIIAIVASVIIPGRQSWRILRLLRETTEVVEPARLLVARLELGLTRESAALETFAFSGDDLYLRRYRLAQEEDDRLMSALGDKASSLDREAATGIADVRRGVEEWRRSVEPLTSGGHDRVDSRAVIRDNESYDAMLRELAGVTSVLADESTERRERIRAAERLSLFVNVTLVLIALAAAGAVGRLGNRERRLGKLLRLRVAEEETLRDAARANAMRELELREEAERGRQALEKVMASRSRLMRGFSHDVKNPLTAAEGYGSLLSEGIYGDLTVAQAESIARIRRCIRSALALIDDLHELGRAETGHVTVTLGPVELVEVVRTIVEDHRASAESRGLGLVLADVPPSLTVRTDGIRVRQILGNLVSNGIKYTAQGSVSLSMREEAPSGADDHPGWVRIDVRDTGPGIPAEHRQSIFEEFVRLEGNQATGAGLGLAISERLAEALGGRISVESEIGEGSTFTLRLPMQA